MAIEFVDLTCGYGNRKIIEGLNFCLSDGDSVSVLGPNGIGKTTFFKTILGHLKSISGYILLDGKKIDEYSRKELAGKIAYVPQAKSNSYQHTVQDVVLMGRAAYIKRFGSPTKKDIHAAQEAMNALGLSGFEERNYSELSGGEQQTVLIARAIAQKAKLIIMDEPASNLDFKNQKKLLEIIKKLSSQNISVIMATHSPDHAFLCSNMTLLINKQHKYRFGLTSDIITDESLFDAFGVNIHILNDVDKNGKKINSSCILLE